MHSRLCIAQSIVHNTYEIAVLLITIIQAYYIKSIIYIFDYDRKR